MPKFTDAQAREWSLAIDAFAIEQIREDCDAQFLKGHPSETFARLDDDPALLCTTVWILCREQAKERVLDQRAFFLDVIGDSIDDASRALEDAILSFIPRRHRELLKVTAAKNEKLQEVGTRKTIAALSSPDFDAEVESAVDRVIGQVMTELASAGKPRDSSGSAPAD